IELVNKYRSTPRPIKIAAAYANEPDVVTTPRQAFFAPNEVVDDEDAVGRVSAELICPYPPGVPVLSPGERITQSAMTALLDARDMGTRIAFVSDRTLATFKVLRD
ncbi:MAG: hypothetical protein RL569_143, partial [Actinomycetota bacterium]